MDKKTTKTLLDSITKESLVNALDNFNEKDVPARQAAKKFFIVYNGREIPAKHIIRKAFQNSTGEDLIYHSSEAYTKAFLENFGFEVINKNQDAALDFDENKLKSYIERYRELLTQPRYGENYKWQAIKNFQDKWDIDAPDFMNMLDKSMKPECSLWAASQYLPKKMLLEFCKIDQEQVREMFKVLFDETRNLDYRFSFFKQQAKILLNTLGIPSARHTYQDDRAISLYLTLKYPETYSFYKFTMYKEFLEEINSTKQIKMGDFENFTDYLELIEDIKKYLVKNQRIILLNTQRLLNEDNSIKQDYYNDPELNLLTQDFIFCVTAYLKPKNIELNKSRLFKISHGPKVINEDIFQELQRRKKIIVNEYTRAKGRSEETQAETFIDTMQKGDYFYLCRGADYCVLIGRITSDAEPCELEKWAEEGWVQRSYEIVSESVLKTHYVEENRWWSPKNNSTVIEIGSHNLDEANRLLFHKYFNVNFSKNTNTSNPMIFNNPNIILYGPPGTGKTYQSITNAVAIIDNWSKEKLQEKLNTLLNDAQRKEIKDRYDELKKEGQIEFITFHQNYSYEDFVQGLKPDIDNSEEHLRFKAHKGIFYDACAKARENWIKSQDNPSNFDPDFDEVFDAFISPLENGEVTDIEIPMADSNYNYRITDIDDERKRISYTKASGGRGHKIVVNTLRKLYAGTISVSNSGPSSYYYPLLEVLKRKAKSYSISQLPVEHKNYVLIIDEINRANISRVFGELITLIEKDKRLGEKNHIQVKLPSGELFSVPPNLYILGTMNTADKSIALVDIALRRRFEFIPMYPQANLLDPSLQPIFRLLNNAIYEQKNKSADFLLGHAYFMGKTRVDLKELLEKRIIPLLNEYFMNNTEKVKGILTNAHLKCELDPDTFQLKYIGVDESSIATIATKMAKTEEVNEA